jgi:hypothetical protein
MHCQKGNDRGDGTYSCCHQREFGAILASGVFQGRKTMKKLTWASILVCILSSASLAAEPDAAGTSGAGGGASKGADTAGWGGSGSMSMTATVTTIVVLTGVVMAAVLSGSDDPASTTSHVP